MKKIITIFLFFIPYLYVYAQTYQGPAVGNIAAGAIVTTEDFLTASSVTFPAPEQVRNILRHQEEMQIIDFGISMSDPLTKYINDPGLAASADTAKSILLNDFSGIAQTNSIPPDPHIAVGPNHIVATVNSRFAIWDKEGNQIENIDADAWYRSVLSPVSAFDPKVLYDHFENRWIMVWLHQNDNTKLSYYLLSVSDDDDPTGIWYNWALPSYTNGNDSTDAWGDYQGVGFDDEALYLTSNQFKFGSNFQYLKIRIIPKTEIYDNTPGAVSWFDIWDVKYPHNNNRVFNIRPSITYSPEESYYLLHAPGAGGNFVSLFKIINPTSSPLLTGVNVPVTFYNNAPNANQLDGGAILLEGGGSALRHEPVHKDGFIWAVHSVANPTDPQYSALQYLKINVNTGMADEDFIFGSSGYWHTYPALAVDKDLNVAVTYSRSGDSEYAGAFYTSRIKDDPPGFQPGTALQTGKANYVKDFNSGRNRWGDYNGIWIDPSDQNNFWMFTEYAAAANTWGTWVGQLRLVPFQGVYLKASSTSLNFGDVEVNTNSDTLAVEIMNLGEDDLVISSIQNSVNSFNLISNITYPVTLKSYESLFLHFLFSPNTVGLFDADIPISSNDPNFTVVNLEANAYNIIAAEDDIFYASSGNANNGNILEINPASGEGAIVGPSLYNEIKSIAIHPKTHVIYGVSTKQDSTELVRVNAEGGDSYLLHRLPLGNMYSIAFDTSGALYGALRTGEIYDLDLNSGEHTLQCTSKAFISGIAFNPVDNDLWAAAFVVVGSNKDRVYKINLETGDTVVVGKTGFNILTNAITFDEAGNLFGVTGTATLNNNLISIDKSTGTGTIVGNIGYKNITGLAMATGTVTSVRELTEEQVPVEYSLKQNYPNPFNPVTSIDFALPVDAKVRLIVYNLLGEIVAELTNGEKPAGSHKVIWNAQSLSSGIYFYELIAAGSDGTRFSEMRKTILMK